MAQGLYRLAEDFQRMQTSVTEWIDAQKDGAS